MELNKAKQQIKEADTAIASQKAEIEKLNHIINEADQERIRQKKEYDIVVNERDILGTQLIRRNDELALLYEKIKVRAGGGDARLRGMCHGAAPKACAPALRAPLRRLHACSPHAMRPVRAPHVRRSSTRRCPRARRSTATG